MKAEGVAHAVEEGANDHLRFRVLAFDAGHVPRAPFFGEAVFHSKAEG